MDNAEKPTRKSWLSEYTAKLIRAKHSAHASYTAIGRALKRCASTTSRFFQRATDARAALHKRLNELDAGVRWHCKDDLAQTLRNKKVRASNAAQYGICKELHDVIKQCRKRPKRSSLLLVDPGGNPIRNNQEESAFVKRTVARLAHGHVTNFQEHLDNVRSNPPSQHLPEFTPDPNAVVGLVDTRRKYHKAPVDKAGGLFDLPPEAYHLLAPELARLWDPLILHSTLTCVIALQWQGGDLALLEKVGGVASQNFANRRRISMVDQTPMAAASTLRLRYLEAIQGHIVTS